ncbi:MULTISPECIES: hypothetical protein [unclassified Fibrobacter]|uniref:hypothetical protein n=1 Tax=unclassified Fibrobacter TaxID=2634177 RepID=UPI000923EDFA|nr:MULTISPECIES: hypothetical protein [unclassified Fibrobacter]OWV07152.1 hypothetical protein B7992_14535 [Fibrobacter sp. UWH1]SHK46051.1 hypothetical protein SAMN05720764_101479 [Fibrobacter sp. UWH5]
MKKFFMAVALICVSSFALTLEDVKRGLSANVINPDSLEYRVHTVVIVPTFGSQATDYHYVTKGKNKVYFEMRSSLVNQRMIQSGEKMKTVDLVTQKERITSYNGEIEKLASVQNVSNTLGSGNWKEPVRIEGSLYKIEGDSSVVYYDSAKKQVQKMEQNVGENSSVMTFEYDDATKQISAMHISVLVGAQETKVDMTFSVYQSSAKFPDRYFEF